MGRGKTITQWDEWTDKMKAKHKNGNGHGKSLEIEAQRLLPTPAASLHKFRLKGDSQQSKNLEAQARRGELTEDNRFGQYGPAISRWEQHWGKAPSPTEPGSKGQPVLSPKFVEWLMGLPAGWVTDVDLSRTQQLKLLGNGVVPSQALAALGLLWPIATCQTEEVA
jgi:DNA (cytosine-5)-methyltransferase 1